MKRASESIINFTFHFNLESLQFKCSQHSFVYKLSISIESRIYFRKSTVIMEIKKEDYGEYDDES